MHETTEYRLLIDGKKTWYLYVYLVFSAGHVVLLRGHLNPTTSIGELNRSPAHAVNNTKNPYD